MKEPGRRLKPGAMFGRYRIVRRLGRGGMGVVYEGIHAELEKHAAIKVLLRPMAQSPELRARFLREGQAAARIRHAHVVDLYDVGELDGVPFLVMELLEGEDLGKLLAREGRLTVERAADLLIPVLSAIAAVHEEGIIHRDLKPANIFLSRDRYGEVIPKVLDFGVSKLTDERLQDALTGTGTIFGTPIYMSPEQARGDKTLDPKSDQYALGVILYQCLTGKRPFEADSMYAILHHIVEGSFPRPQEVNPALDQNVDAIVMRAMAKTPAHRFADVHEFGSALVGFASERVRGRWSHVFRSAEKKEETPLARAPTQPAPEEPEKLAPTMTFDPAAELHATREVAAEPHATLAPEHSRTEHGVFAAPRSVVRRSIAALAGPVLLLAAAAVIWSWRSRPVPAESANGPARPVPAQTLPAQTLPAQTLPALPVPALPLPAQTLLAPEAQVEPETGAAQDLGPEPEGAPAEEKREPPRPAVKKPAKKNVRTGTNNAPILE